MIFAFSFSTSPHAHNYQFVVTRLDTVFRRVREWPLARDREISGESDGQEQAAGSIHWHWQSLVCVSIDALPSAFTPFGDPDSSLFFLLFLSFFRFSCPRLLVSTSSSPLSYMLFSAVWDDSTRWRTCRELDGQARAAGLISCTGGSATPTETE